LTKTNQEIIDYLIADIHELIGTREQFVTDDLDGFYDYLSGIIERSQTILRMMGVPEEQIPNDGSC
jgi:hypothetical protein